MYYLFELILEASHFKFLNVMYNTNSWFCCDYIHITFVHLLLLGSQ